MLNKHVRGLHEQRVAWVVGLRVQADIINVRDSPQCIHPPARPPVHCGARYSLLRLCNLPHLAVAEVARTALFPEVVNRYVLARPIFDERVQQKAYAPVKFDVELLPPRSP